jgi:methylenetetrahydrofolate dehydrogenase (NADP+) / methenyltetrahydrofolate cyclohydrolase
MPAIILDGKSVAKKIKDELKEKISKLNSKPCLVVILVGKNPASQMYVSMKEKACSKVGINVICKDLPVDVSEKKLIAAINGLNNDSEVHGILIQLPLPVHINTQKILSLLDPSKDVDGFCPLNLGRLTNNDELFVAATPLGIIRLVEEYGINVEGMDAVVVNHSVVVGRPLSQLLLNRNATVTVCHVKTKDLSSYTKNADLLISGTGVPGLITEDMVKDGVIVVDVGISEKDGKIVGDVDFERVKEKASHITPVPGGVGPMTIAALMENTLKAYQLRK